jgi:hypothetical protein
VKRFTFIVAWLGLSVAGCQERADQSEGVFRTDGGEYVLTIALDLSGSFEELMAEDGKAWAFVCQVLDKYFRDRLGHSDKLILAQLSGSEQSLLWRGTPLELRQEFPSAAAFRDWLVAHTDPHGSRIYDGITQAVEYTLADPVMSSGKGKAAVFILSDLCDTGPNQKEKRKRVIKSLAEVARRDGVIGLYYVDVPLVPKWRKVLTDAGVPAANLQIEADIVGRPLLPSFE